MSERPSRYDRLDRHATPGPHNALWHWTEARSPLRVAVNYAVVVLARVAPSLRLKNWLLRRIGVTVGDGVAWGLEATPDVFWPELVTVEDHAVVGYDATLLCHEFLREEYRTGEVVIGEGALVGAGAVVLPGVEVGAGAQVAANSLVVDDVPPGVTVAGVPAEPVRNEAADDRDGSDGGPADDERGDGGPADDEWGDSGPADDDRDGGNAAGDDRDGSGPTDGRPED